MPTIFLSRWFWEALAVVAVVAFLGYEKHSYDERRRDEGRLEVQTKWDADANRRNAAAAQQAASWNDDRLAAEKAQQELKNERQARQDDAKRSAANLPSTIRDAVVPRVGGMLDRAIIDTTAAARSAEQPNDDSAAVTVGRWADWSVEVIGMYDSCRTQVVGWINFYSSLQAAQPKGIE